MMMDHQPAVMGHHYNERMVLNKFDEIDLSEFDENINECDTVDSKIIDRIVGNERGQNTSNFMHIN
jgi:hypothetical protein